MATYIVLGQFTDQGNCNVADTSKRADAAKELAKKVGAKVIISGRLGVTTWSSSWRRPTHSGLAPARMTMSEPETLRAFTQPEINQILKRVI